MIVDVKQFRLFGLILSAVICFWLSFAYLRTSNTNSMLWVGYVIPLGLALAALIKPNSLSGIFKIWIYIAETLNKVVVYSLMGIIFFLLITPTALVRRLLGYDELHNKDGLKDSYRVKSKSWEKDDMEHPY